jgi:hypothetical protein
MGFLSRALLASYVLAPEDVLRGEGLIYEGREAFRPIELRLPGEAVDVSLPGPRGEELRRLGRVLAALNRDETGFRSHKHVIALAKASALREGRYEVSREDIGLLRALSVLWLSAYSGDEPSFRMMLRLPATASELVEALAPLYSRATVYRRLEHLSRLVAVREEGGRCVANL